MRYLFTVLWALLIGSAISYMLGAMGGQEFSLTRMFIMAGLICLAVFVIGEGVLKPEKEA